MEVANPSDTVELKDSLRIPSEIMNEPRVIDKTQRPVPEWTDVNIVVLDFAFIGYTNGLLIELVI